MTSKESKLARWVLPSPADALFLVVLFAAAVLRGVQAIDTDGDFARHLRVGKELLTHSLFFTDKFSWTMYGHHFVPYEWGSEVLYALARRIAGIFGAVVLMGILCAAAYAVAYLLLVRRAVDPVLAFLTAMAAAAAGSYHWLVRPHMFSLLGVVCLMWLLESMGDLTDAAELPSASPGAPSSRTALSARLAIVAVFFCLWANIHAGFLIGLALIGFYLVGNLLDLVLKPTDASRKAALSMTAMLIAALAGTCLNPSGPGVITHLLSFFQMPWLVDATMEMRSPDFHAWYGRTFLVLLMGCIFVLAMGRQRMKGRHLVALLGTTALALQSARNIEIWALTGLLITAMYADGLWRQVPWRPLVHLRTAFSGGAGMARGGLWSAVAAVAAIGLALHGGHIANLQLMPAGFDPGTFPVRVVERARAASVSGRMLNELAWGGYVLYAWPEQKVFIDGQTDFYGDSLSQLYMDMRLAKPGWEQRLDSLEVQMVLMPDDVPLVWVLEKSAGWTVADSADGAVRLMRRADSGAP
jgi:hypothetical protein